MTTKTQLTESEETKRGELLAQVLELKPCKLDNGERLDPPRYHTKWGTKTALGLFRTVARIVEDGE